MQFSNARAAGWTAMILAALLIPPPCPARAGEGLQIIASLLKAIQSPGRIDYAERINAPLREGVTPENNFFAAIFPLLRVSSLDESHGEWVQALCDEIGCVHPAEESVKYVAPNDADYPMEVTESDIRESIQQAMLCPCSADENVIVHSWIRANEECWERVVEAADRSHSYRPLIPPAGRPLDWSLLPDVETCHGLTTLGLVRVQNDVHSGDLESARRTLITMQKLFRHLGTSATFVQKEMSHTCESLVVLAQSSYLAHPKLTSADRWNYLTEVEQLPPVISAADSLDQIDRWAAFDALQFNRSGILDPTEEGEFSDDPEILKRQRLVRLLLALAANPSDMENGLNSLHDSAGKSFDSRKVTHDRTRFESLGKNSEFTRV